MNAITPQLMQQAAQVALVDQEVADWLYALDENAFFNFVPRPDRPQMYDQQASFCNNRDQVSFLIGGNAAGTTEAASFKTAQFLLRHQPPPRKNTPFWVISNTYDQVCGVCWDEKLFGHGHIPDWEIDWDGIAWKSKTMGYPYAVPLKPWPVEKGGDPDKNWMIEFKSYEQGRRALQARSIGGFWFSEQFPLDLFLETLRGCREYMFDGGQFAEFTPIEPELSMWIEQLMEDPPDGWEFYRANTEMNKPNLAEGWYEQFFSTVPEELLETRKTGALAIFEGVIYQSFLKAIHVIDEDQVSIPPGCFHSMGTDWGASEEHKHATIFGARDGKGDWIIYDEYSTGDQSRITEDHVNATLDICQRWGWPVREREEKGKNKKIRYIDNTNATSFGVNYADPSRPGEITEYNKRGIPTAPASNKVYEGINEVRSLLRPNPYAEDRPRLLISSRCKNLITGIRKYRWMRGKKPTGGAVLNPSVAQPKPLKQGDDECDAFRYLIYNNRSGHDIAAKSTQREQAERKSVQLSKKKGRNGFHRGGSFQGLFSR